MIVILHSCLINTEVVCTDIVSSNAERIGKSGDIVVKNPAALITVGGFFGKEFAADRAHQHLMILRFK